MSSNFCTYFDSNYLLKGLALHESLERHCSGYHLWILALDGQALNILASMKLPNVSIIALPSFETSELRTACVDRSTVERYWTYTPWWINFVLDNALVSHIAYVDADLYYFHDPAPVFDEMRGKGVAITPHRFPQKYMGFITSGVYNVGMVYVERDHQKARECIHEWQALCTKWCYYRHDPNDPYRFCDQKYWELLVPKHDAHSIQHLGANLAPWNAIGYQYDIRGNHLYVDGQPLIWYHFHGLTMVGDHVTDLCPPTYRPLPPMVEEHIYRPYIQALDRMARKVK